MTVKIGEPCRSVECWRPAGHDGDHEDVNGFHWPATGPENKVDDDDWKTTLKVPDSPKMLRETLCAAQRTIISYMTGVMLEDQRLAHVGRLQRLIDECDRHRPLGADGKHGDRHTATCGCDPDKVAAGSFEAVAEHGWQQARMLGAYQTGLFAGLKVGNPLQPVHDAVTEVIRDHPSGATDDYGHAVENARVWRAVDAALGALGIKR